MQKAIIIEHSDWDKRLELDASELNRYLSEGWRFVSAAPFGCSTSDGGKSDSSGMAAAILVIIEKP